MLMLFTLNFHGDRGGSVGTHIAKLRVMGVLNMANAVGLGAALGSFSAANTGRLSLVDFVAGTTTPPGTDVNMDVKATIYFVDSADGSQHSLTISGWDTVGHPPDAKSEGDRVALLDVLSVVAAVNAATGKSYTPSWGKLYKTA